MAVGTGATVKAMRPEDIAATGTEVVLGNTYHLMLRPGAERVERLGGLHRMMGWNRPILTDCGGFQVMSLSALRKISEDGVEFSSHIDGSRHMLTPERSVEIQRCLDSDITMAFDECPPYPAEKAYVRDATARAMRWEERSLAAFRRRAGYGIFGINQGGMHEDLRRDSAETLAAQPFDGYAVGGLALGEGQELMFRTLDFTVPFLPAGRPRYLMGVGTLSDLVGAVERGIDMFDCVMPTRSGRTALAFLRHGKLNMRNACHADDPSPLDPACPCRACRFSRAYLHHLVKSGEILGAMLLTEHNLTVWQRLMADMRAALTAGSFADFAAEFWENERRAKTSL